MTQLIGRQLGKYEIQSYIGGGGMADVYKGYHPMLRKIVAIKVLKPERSKDPSFVKAFVNEAVTAAQLNHLHIVTIYDVGEQDGIHYIAMEYVSGQSLQQLIRTQNGLSPELVCELFDSIADALNYAHSRGFVHCDVKPGNILLDAEGQVMLTDFGIARAVEQTPEEEGQTKRVGSPRYMSPEHVLGKPLDHRSDIYSLGVVLFEMLTGRVPFDGGTSSQILKAHVSQRPPPPSSVREDLPKEVDRVVLRALAKNPEARYQNALQMAQDVRRTLLTEKVPGLQAEGEARALPALHRLPWVPVGIAGVALILFVAVMFLWRGNSKPQTTPTHVAAVPTLTLAEILLPSATLTPPLGPTSTLLPTETQILATATPTPMPPTATRVPTAVPVRYDAPSLLDPADGAGIHGDTIHLRWSWNGTLKSDENFELWVGPKDDPGRLKQSLKATDVTITPPGGVGVYYWKVRVIRGEVGKPGAVDLSPWSDVRNFDYKGTPPTPEPLPTRP